MTRRYFNVFAIKSQPREVTAVYKTQRKLLIEKKEAASESYRIDRCMLIEAVTTRSSCSQMLFKIGVLKNFEIFRGKHPCWSLF